MSAHLGEQGVDQTPSAVGVSCSSIYGQLYPRLFVWLAIYIGSDIAKAARGEDAGQV
jgi:hypothetical protein